MNNGPALKVLIIAPHLDDEVLGCGGAIRRHVTAGDTVQVCFVAHRVYGHKYDAARMAVELDHAEKVRNQLGYKAFELLDLPDERLDNCLQEIIIPLEGYVQNFKPQIVYSPFIGDNNQDHQAVARAVQVVLRPSAVPYVQRWLVYETPSSTEQAPAAGQATSFSPSFYLDIANVMDAKIDALQHYETEARAYPHPRSLEGLRALAMKRGMEAGLALAEAFMLMREIG